MNKLLNHDAQVFRWILKIVFCQVPKRFFAHSLAQFGSDNLSIRQVTHRKPPFYSSSTKRFSCDGISTCPLAGVLHEQDTVNLKESLLYSGQEKVTVEGTTRELKMETFSGRRRPDWQRKPGTKAAVASRQK